MNETTATKMKEKLYDAGNYADAIAAIAKTHLDDPSYVLLADNCSKIVCAVADELRGDENKINLIRRALEDIIENANSSGYNLAFICDRARLALAACNDTQEQEGAAAK